MSAFGGKAGHDLLRESTFAVAIGGKGTSLFAAHVRYWGKTSSVAEHMSASDPKRTFALNEHVWKRYGCCLVRTMRRRDFIAALVGSAAAFATGARAQQSERMLRIGVLMHVTEKDSDGQARLAAFLGKLKELGWIEGRNLRVDIRWGPNDPNRYPRQAAELIALTPDVLVAPTSFTLAPLQRATRNVPIVFMGVIDPVGAGFVSSLSKPGGNTTGFVAFEYTIGAKWLGLLKELSPQIDRVAVLRDSANASGVGQFAAIQAAGMTGIDLSVIAMQNTGDIERDVAAFSRGSNAGLIVTASPFGANHPDVIASLAARYKLPTIYPFRYFIEAGGLMSYGTELVNQSPPAAVYVDRILKGEKPADLPVQAPTKYELIINLKAAKALGLVVPGTLLARADTVIE
jgi:ABC-type uncharacterized transport system substrate-binding protein